MVEKRSVIVVMYLIVAVAAIALRVDPAVPMACLILARIEMTLT